MAGTESARRPYTFITVSTLKEHLQSELHETRIGTWRSRGHNAKVLIIGTTADGVRRGELSSVKQVKELCSEFDTQALAARESCSLEYRKIKVIDSLGAQSRIHARFITELKITRRGETRGIEPLRQA